MFVSRDLTVSLGSSQIYLALRKRQHTWVTGLARLEELLMAQSYVRAVRWQRLEKGIVLSSYP